MDERDQRPMHQRPLKNHIAILLLLSWVPLTFLLSLPPTYMSTEKMIRGLSGLPDYLAEKGCGIKEDQKRAFEDNVSVLLKPEALRKSWLELLWAWSLICFALGLGFFSCFMAVYRVRFWRLALFGSSLFYIIIFVRPSRTFIPTLETAQFWWMFATRMSNGFLYAYKDLVFSLIQVIVILTLSFQFLKRKWPHGLPLKTRRELRGPA
jgi:hypothetical protein